MQLNAARAAVSTLAPRSGERVARAQRGPGEGPTRAAIAVVIAGLDPAIHPLRKKGLTKGMDPRVKPAGDERRGGAWLPLTRLAPSALATLSPLRGARVHRVRGASQQMFSQGETSSQTQSAATAAA